MTTETPHDDWVLLEAAKRGNMLHWGLEQLRTIYKTGCIFTALCDMIQKHEKPPEDRKLLCAREASAETYTTIAEEYRKGELDHLKLMRSTIRAIELYEEGFGK
jgi:hypothetical protein